MSHSIPYQVGLISKKVAGKKIFCGGSLISPNYVVTGHFCCRNIHIVKFQVSLYFKGLQNL